MVMEMKPQDLPVPAVVDVADACSLTPIVPVASVTDNCDDDIDIVFTESIQDIGCGQSYTWTWTVVDDCGNQTVETRTEDVFDSTDPILSEVPADITVSCEGDIPVAIPFDCTTTFQNVALGKSVSQSSDNYSGSTTGAAEKAVDGNTDGVWGSGSTTHTTNEANAWWEVDLGEVVNIDSIEIWGRTDCCANRVSDYYM